MQRLACCEFVFSLFGLQWALHSYVRSNLLGWHVSFGEKKVKKLGGYFFATFVILRKKIMEEIFNDIECFDEAIKVSFLYAFANRPRVYRKVYNFVCY